MTRGAERERSISLNEGRVTEIDGRKVAFIVIRSVTEAATPQCCIVRLVRQRMEQSSANELLFAFVRLKSSMRKRTFRTSCFFLRFESNWNVRGDRSSSLLVKSRLEFFRKFARKTVSLGKFFSLRQRAISFIDVLCSVIITSVGLKLK